MNQYFNKIRDLIIDRTGLEADEIHMESFFEEDLNLDEMELTEMISDIEEMFQIDIMESKDDIATVEDLIDLISEQVE